MVRPAFDETLADLASITATVNRTTAQASATEPCIATVTIPAHLLQSILTAASLHYSDNPHVPKPEVGEHAEMIASNNAQSQDWYWEMRDTIEILSARVSVAQAPDYPQNGLAKERGVATDRKHRALFAKMDKDQRAAAEATDPTTLEGLTARWDAANIEPLTDGQMLKLMAELSRGVTPFYKADDVTQLFERWRKDSSDLEKARTRLSAVISAAQGH